MELFKQSFRAMGCAGEVQLYVDSHDEGRRISTLVESEVLRIEKKYSRYLENSITTQINSAAGKSAVAVDEETLFLIRYADLAFKQSDGLFDISSGILRRVWDFQESVLPTQVEIDEILQLVGWDKIELEGSKIGLSISGMEIDFGGIGKEYAVDQADALLRREGVSSGFVNLGGDIRVLGPQPQNQPWNIGISHPRCVGTAISYLKIYQGAIASSGDYERFFELDGIRYSHILSPLTGWPAQGFQGVSVLHETCLVAGSLASIAMLKGESKGKQFLENLGVAFAVIDSSGNYSSFPGKTAAISSSSN